MIAWQWTIFTALEIAAFFALATIGLVNFLYFSDRRGYKEATLLIFIGAVWMLAHAMETGSTNFEAMEFFHKVQFACLIALSTVWLVYVIIYLGNGRWLTPRNLILLGTIPLITTILIFTNDFHNLIWANMIVHPQNQLVLIDNDKGVVGWFCLAYVMVLFMVSSAILVVKIMHVPRFGQRHLGILVIAVGIFLLTSLFDLFNIEHVIGIPITPAGWGFTVGSIIVAWNLPRLRLGEILPIARETIIESISDGVVILDNKDRILDINPAALDLIGCSFSDAYGEPVNELWKDWSNSIKPVIEMKDGNSEVTLHRNGLFYSYDIRVSQLMDTYNVVIGRSLVFRDVTERKVTEEALRQSEERFRQFFEHDPEYCFMISPDLEIIDVNNAALQVIGYEKGQLIGKPVEVIYSHESSQKLKRHLVSLGEKGELQDKEMVILTNKGIRRSVLLSASAVRDNDGKLLYSIVVLKDITERKYMEEQLKYMATHDILTGLPNRVLLKDRLSVAIAQSTRNRKMLAIMMLDLDDFKKINDKLGHSIGDELLKLVGERLMKLQRKGDTIARIGGDEFLVISLEIADIPDSSKIAKKILDGFKNPFIVDKSEVYITPSIGIAIFPYDGSSIDTLINNADTAMYRAKERGGNRYLLYCPSHPSLLTPMSV